MNLNTKLIILSVFLSWVLNYDLNAQAKMNGTARLFQYELNKFKPVDSKTISQKLINNYQLTSINNRYYIGVATLVNSDNINHEKLKQIKVLNNSRIGNIWTFKVPIENFLAFTMVEGIEYLEIGDSQSTDLIYAISDTKVDSIHSGLGGVMQSYKGEGVVIGVIDVGFDYTHPTFYDSSGTQLRITRAWDQNKTTGNPPQGFAYGSEYKTQDELIEAGEDTLTLSGPSSHGTHVAGISGGNGAGTEHIGAAPESELVFVTRRNNDATATIDAFNYIENYAASVGKPFVINMSFGGQLGAHDGSTLNEIAIDSLHGPGKIFVASAGNNGAPNFHLDYNFQENPNDTIKTVIGFVNVENYFGQTISLWGSKFSSFSIAIRLADVNHETLYQTPFYYSSDEPIVHDTILYGPNQDTLIIVLSSEAQSPLNDKDNIRIDIKRTGPTRVVLLATSTDTHLHMWNVIRQNHRVLNAGVGLFGSYPGSIEGDRFYGGGAPGTGKSVITVASYRAQRVLPSGTAIYGSISSFSSFGPTVDDRIKPDIASTGEHVISSFNSFIDLPQPISATVDFNGTGYTFTPLSGTSMSTPMVSGIIALMLQVNPQLSALQAKEILKSTARLDQFTGQIDNNGDIRWGWGKVNALAAVLATEIVSSNVEISVDESLFELFPNPSKDLIYLKFNKSGNKPITIDIVSIDGKIIKQITSAFQNELSIDVNDLTAGIYLIRVNSGESLSIKKFIVSK